MMTAEQLARDQLEELQLTIESRHLESLDDIFVQSALAMIEHAKYPDLYPTSIITALSLIGFYSKLLRALSATDKDRLKRDTTEQGYVLRTPFDRGWYEILVLAQSCGRNINSSRS